jgi:hypothetical protein
MELSCRRPGAPLMTRAAVSAPFDLWRRLALLSATLDWFGTNVSGSIYE